MPQLLPSVAKSDTNQNSELYLSKGKEKGKYFFYTFQTLKNAPIFRVLCPFLAFELSFILLDDFTLDFDANRLCFKVE